MPVSSMGLCYMARVRTLDMQNKHLHGLRNTQRARRDNVSSQCCKTEVGKEVQIAQNKLVGGARAWLHRSRHRHLHPSALPSGTFLLQRPRESWLALTLCAFGEVAFYDPNTRPNPETMPAMRFRTPPLAHRIVRLQLGCNRERTAL